jgi:hypothetical protein
MCFGSEDIDSPATSSGTIIQALIPTAASSHFAGGRGGGVGGASGGCDRHLV